MKPSDEILMAYADNELGPAERAEVEAAMAADPELARRVARHKALRAELNTVFDGALKEPVPERLIRTVWSAPGAKQSDARGNGATGARGYANNVTHLAQVRAARAGKTQAHWSMRQLGAVAASLIIGIVLGQLIVHPANRHPIVQRDGAMIAQGVLDTALSDQLASSPKTDSPVRLGASFQARSGEYCRTFVLQEGTALAGYACRTEDAWRVRMLTQATRGSGTEGWRMANTEIPPIVLQAVEAEIKGEALDANDEQAARDRGWR